MLKGLEKTLNNVIKEGWKSATIGNFKVAKNDDDAISIYHYNHFVAAVSVDLKKIYRSRIYWNYSMSTTRLCNDLQKYFEGYEVK